MHGTLQFTGAIPEAIGAYIGGPLLQQDAQWLNNEVDGIPVLQNLVKPFGDIVNGFGAVLGDLADAAGQSINDLGAAFEHLSQGDFTQAAESVYDAGKDVAVDAYDAAKDAVNSVVDSVEDFFSF